MTCSAWNCLFPNSGLPRISHQFQLPVFRSRAIRQPDTGVRPNSHLLQSQEHNVRMKRCKIARTSLACRARLFICWLRMEVLTLGAGCKMRKVLFRGDEVLGSEERSSKRQPLPLVPALHDCLLIPGTPHYTPDQHIIAMFWGWIVYKCLYRRQRSAGAAWPHSFGGDPPITCYAICCWGSWSSPGSSPGINTVPFTTSF